MTTKPSTWPFQAEGPVSPSLVVGSDEALRGVRREEWTEADFANARPLPVPQPSLPPGAAQPAQGEWPITFLPPRIDVYPYTAICKVYFRRQNVPYVASGWIVHGDTGLKGILTSGHVVWDGGHWSRDYVVRRCYADNCWAEEFRGSFARTLHGWMHGQYPREFFDLGAIIPDAPISEATPSLAVAASYDPLASPFNYFFDAGYPAKPANQFPFNGELMWESDGPLIAYHTLDQRTVLQTYNAMEQGSSGSPWMVYHQASNTHWVAGMQTSGWDDTPSSYSPYFEQRNIVALLREIRVLG